MSGGISWISVHLIALIELLHAYSCYHFNYLFAYVRLFFEQIFFNSVFQVLFVAKS